jgi:2-keto-4-pentenoate hydratase/2-oxohepta-3-ene-1,7-dioic acid hydratase in catechol pathway
MMARLCRYRVDGRIASGIVLGDRVVELQLLNEALGLSLPILLGDLVKSEALPTLVRQLADSEATLGARGIPLSSVTLLAPFPNPPKIWCIGLNYDEHASDLDERSPDEPASFMRPSISMRGPGDSICLPPESSRVTGEAELAVVIGRRCKYITRADAHGVIGGFVPAIDMTAEDILRRNPRFLTRSKSFDTFLSVGPMLVTPDEIGGPEQIRAIRVTTVLNGEARRSNTGNYMTHDIFDLIAFHSRVFTWEPGDILLTGTPGAVHIRAGDVIGCDIEGIGRLENPVVALPADGRPFPAASALFSLGNGSKSGN